MIPQTPYASLAKLLRLLLKYYGLFTRLLRHLYDFPPAVCHTPERQGGGRLSWVYHDTRSRDALRTRSIIMAATIDEALEIVPRTGPEVVGAHSNHGAMVAEALAAQGPPDSVLSWKEEMGLPSHGQATVWGTPVGLDRAREGAGWRQQLRQWWGARREAHRRAQLAALNCCWDPKREIVRPLRAEAAFEITVAQAGAAL